MSYIKSFDKDIYFLEIVGDKIIINDDYSGISVLDFELNLIKRVNIMEGLIVYSAFDNGKSILLFCPDNACVVYVDMETFDHHIFSLEGLENRVFSDLYCYDDDWYVLSDYDGEFLRLDIGDRSAELISKEYLNKNMKVFRDEYFLLSRYTPYKIFNKLKKAVIEDCGKMAIASYSAGSVYILKRFDKTGAHDFELDESCFASISEKRVDLFIYDKNSTYYPSNGYTFLRAKLGVIDHKKYMFILSGGNSRDKADMIERFDIIK